jgi:hypothetical protein
MNLSQRSEDKELFYVEYAKENIIQSYILYLEIYILKCLCKSMQFTKYKEDIYNANVPIGMCRICYYDEDENIEVW